MWELQQIAILRTNSQSRNSYFEKIFSHFLHELTLKYSSLHNRVSKILHPKHGIYIQANGTYFIGISSMEVSTLNSILFRKN